MSHEKVSLMSRPFPPIPNFGSTGSNGANSDDDKDGRFVCNICLDPVVDPVSTLCGHLYCWPCLYRWLDTQHTTCPVCLAGVSRENGDTSAIPYYMYLYNTYTISLFVVIPLFIKGSENDPRSSSQGDIPNRPNGQRPEVSPAARNTGTGLGTGTGHYGGLPFTAGIQVFC